MNPSTSTWINVGITMLLAGLSAWQAAGGGSGENAILAGVAAAVAALNTMLHAYSTPQPGPMNK